MSNLKWVFSTQHERMVNNDNTVALDNRVRQLNQTRWRNPLAGPSVVAHEHLDGRVSIRYGPHVIAQYQQSEFAGTSAAQARHPKAGDDPQGSMKHNRQPRMQLEALPPDLRDLTLWAGLRIGSRHLARSPNRASFRWGSSAATTMVHRVVGNWDDPVVCAWSVVTFRYTT